MQGVDDGALKLAAMDEADLAILSSHLQDAVLKRSDMDYAPSARRFALACNRFDWLDAAAKDDGGLGAKVSKLVGKGPTYRRRRASLVIDHVTAAAHCDFGADPDEALDLLSVLFVPSGREDDPSGHVLLHFAGGARVRLAVDCVEARLIDEGPVWATHARPQHRGNGAS